MLFPGGNAGMTIFQTIINCLTLFFLKARIDSPIALLINALAIFGLWGIFRKSGLTPWHALIPCLREADLGKAAGMEKEERPGLLPV